MSAPGQATRADKGQPDSVRRLLEVTSTEELLAAARISLGVDEHVLGAAGRVPDSSY